MEKVNLSLVRKQLRKLPPHIVTKLMGWVFAVETLGIEEIRKIPGFHDEPLKGNRRGSRSIRLSKSYRAIYREDKNETIVEIIIEEVNKHEY